MLSSSVGTHSGPESNFGAVIEATSVDNSIDKGGKDLVVQVIHESVRDFLFGDTALEILPLDSVTEFVRSWQERLKSSCLANLSIEELRGVPPVRLLDKGIPSAFSSFLYQRERQRFWNDSKQSKWKTSLCRCTHILEHPFTSYATRFWLFHASEANFLGEPQLDLFHWARSGAFERWISLAQPLCDPRVINWTRIERSLRPEELIFHIACKVGINSPIAHFVGNGVDPLCKIEGNGPALLIAASYGHDKVVSALLDCGVSVETCRTPSTTNALHEAVNNGSLEVVKLVLDRGINPETPSGNGQPALCLAANQGRKEIILALAKGGANVNCRGRGGWSPLHQLARLGPHDSGTREGWSIDCAQALIDAGADTDALDDSGKTPFALAALKGSVEMVPVRIFRAIYTLSSGMSRSVYDRLPEFKSYLFQSLVSYSSVLYP